MPDNNECATCGEPHGIMVAQQKTICREIQQMGEQIDKRLRAATFFGVLTILLALGMAGGGAYSTMINSRVDAVKGDLDNNIQTIMDKQQEILQQLYAITGTVNKIQRDVDVIRTNLSNEIDRAKAQDNKHTRDIERLQQRHRRDIN